MQSQNRRWLVGLASGLAVAAILIGLRQTIVSQVAADDGFRNAVPETGQPVNVAAQAEESKPRPKTPLQQFMQGKLGAANQVLEGLVTEDFRLVQKGTTELKRIGNAAKWRITNDAMYRQFSAEYQEKVDRLAKSAKDARLEGATLSYIDVVTSCVECHKWVRAELIAGRPLDQPAAQTVRPNLTIQGGVR